jgi:transposase
MHTFPMQVRLAIVALREESREYAEIASVLGVGIASVDRGLRWQRETGKVDRLARGGRESPIHSRIAERLCCIDEGNDGVLDD